MGQGISDSVASDCGQKSDSVMAHDWFSKKSTRFNQDDQFNSMWTMGFILKIPIILSGVGSNFHFQRRKSPIFISSTISINKTPKYILWLFLFWRSHAFHTDSSMLADLDWEACRMSLPVKSYTVRCRNRNK